MSDDFTERLAAAKADNLGHLLLKAARLFNELALARTEGEPAVRPSHTALFPHIDLAGTRLTELARRVGITKQAVSALVDDLETMRVVERVPDPTDGRAKLVRFTDHGRQRLLQGLEILGAVEAEMVPAIGPAEVEPLKSALRRLIDALEAS